MKKLLCALLALAMLCACAAAETVDVTGTWYLTKSYNEKFDLDCVQRGLDATLTLQPDGTVDMDAQWEFMSRIWEDEVGPDETTDEEPPAEIRWKMDGDKVILTYENNETRELTLVDGNLVEIEEEFDTTQVYSREKPVLNYFDPGAPLTPQECRDIFKRFYRVDHARAMNHSYGLGLAIAARIAEAHRGRIWAESSGGINTFYFTIPI